MGNAYNALNDLPLTSIPLTQMDLVDLLKDRSVGARQAELDDLAGWEALLFWGEWLRRHAATGGTIRQ